MRGPSRVPLPPGARDDAGSLSAQERQWRRSPRFGGARDQRRPPPQSRQRRGTRGHPSQGHVRLATATGRPDPRGSARRHSSDEPETGSPADEHGPRRRADIAKRPRRRHVRPGPATGGAHGPDGDTPQGKPARQPRQRATPSRRGHPQGGVSRGTRGATVRSRAGVIRVGRAAATPQRDTPSRRDRPQGGRISRQARFGSSQSAAGFRLGRPVRPIPFCRGCSGCGPRPSRGRGVGR